MMRRIRAISRWTGRLLRANLVVAILVFLFYTGAVAFAGWILFARTDIGDETTTTTTTEEDGLATTVVETKPSETAIAIFTALAASGWVLLPLKFSWDELAKNADARREQNKASAEHRRETVGEMRKTIFTSVESHSGPLLYRQSAIATWADRFLDSSDDEPRIRLLFAVASYQHTYDRLREIGRPILLASVAAERDASEANFDLQQVVFKLLGRDPDAEWELLHAVRAEASDEKLVGYDKFKARVSPIEDAKDCRARRLFGREETPPDAWAAARAMAARFEKATRREANLRELCKAADLARRALGDGLNQVYEEWYVDLPDAKVIPASAMNSAI